MAISPSYKTSMSVEYGSRVLPFQEELRDAYLSDIRERFTEVANSLDAEELNNNLERLRNVKTYVNSLLDTLAILSKSRDEISEDERFLQHSLVNFNLRENLALFNSIIETTDIGLEEFEKVKGKEQETPGEGEKKR